MAKDKKKTGSDLSVLTLLLKSQQRDILKTPKSGKSYTIDIKIIIWFTERFN